MKKWIVRVVVVVALVYVAAIAWIYHIMHLPPAEFAKNFARLPMASMMVLPFESMWMRARAGELSPGDAAPDFDLPTLDRSQKVQLSALRGKPVMLVFGSYTRPPFRREVPALNRIYEDYKDRVAMYVVYIQEAHAADVWQMPSNIKQNVVFAQPKSIEERYGIADSCVRKLNIKMPAIVDSFDDSTERAYTGWPDRIYVLDKDGKVAFKTTPGPFGFEPLEARKVLAKLAGPARINVEQ